MNRESLSVVKTDSEPFETKREIQRDSSGRFVEGTCGGPGGPRPGSGRPPKSADESLVKRLYGLLDSTADRALEVLIEQLEDDNAKISQKAADIILSKVLPEGRFLKSWREEDKEVAEELQIFKDFLAFKRDQDIAELEKKPDEPDRPSETDQEFGEKKKTGK